MTDQESPELGALRGELASAAAAIGTDFYFSPATCDVDPESLSRDDFGLAVSMSGPALHEPSWSRLVEKLDAELAVAREEFLVVVAARRLRMGLAVGRIR